MRAALGDLLRARTQAGDRDHHLDPGMGLAAADLADQRGLVVHQALDARHRRALHDEERETHLDMAGIGVEPRSHLAEHRAERVDRDLALVVQDLDEARHMRALEVVRQVHVHVEGGHGVLLAGRAVLDLDRMADVLDADAVDRNPAGIGARLHVLDRDDILGPRLRDDVHGFTCGDQFGPMPPAAANLVAVRVSFKAGTAARQRSIAAAMLARSRPAAARQSSRLPCSMKRSGMPRCRRGIVIPSASSASAQALPAPAADHVLLDRHDAGMTGRRSRAAARRPAA